MRQTIEAKWDTLMIQAPSTVTFYMNQYFEYFDIKKSKATDKHIKNALTFAEVCAGDYNNCSDFIAKEKLASAFNHIGDAIESVNDYNETIKMKTT